MRVLIVEDHPVTSRLIKEILSPYGECDIVNDGNEAIQAFRIAHEEQKLYDLICMDIMMPNKDGHVALVEVRQIEKEMGIKGPDEVKVIMVSDLGNGKSVTKAYYEGGATSYIVKPIDREKLLEEIRDFGLIT